MELKYFIILAMVFAAVCAYFYVESTKKGKMQITSEFPNNGDIPPKYTCDGENVAPPLKISNIPPEAKTLAVIVDDPDAPSKTWIHWLLFNVMVTSSEMEIKNGSIGTEGINDFKKIGYGGPCPPSGTHHYHFKVYALPGELALSKGATKEEVEGEIEGRVLSKAELVGLYQKNV